MARGVLLPRRDLDIFISKIIWKKLSYLQIMSFHLSDFIWENGTSALWFCIEMYFYMFLIALHITLRILNVYRMHAYIMCPDIFVQMLIINTKVVYFNVLKVGWNDCFGASGTATERPLLNIQDLWRLEKKQRNRYNSILLLSFSDIPSRSETKQRVDYYLLKLTRFSWCSFPHVRRLSLILWILKEQDTG